ncbi:MAG: hypothetical protein AB1810_03530 [Pseudomonadota bacterium]
MSDVERAKLIPVTGNSDTPDMQNAIDVQFNPTTLKVTLSNTLKENARTGNTRATQYVDKSSSTLTVELVFDTTYIEAPAGNNAQAAQSDGSASSNNRNRIEQGSDVRQQTKKIADAFVKPVGSGTRMRAPKRCLFQWGAFQFIGLVDSFEETVDFFSPKGRPLRATVSLKLKEDRYQFRSNDSSALAAEQTPTLNFTGNGAGSKQPGGGSGAGNGAPTPNQNTSPVPGGSAGPGNWRDNAMFNGIESPRLPSLSTLALPSVNLSAGAGFGISGGVDIGLSAGISLNAGISVSASVSASISASASARLGVSAGAAAGGVQTTRQGAPSATPATQGVSPAFKFGNSAALGTGIPGAFHPSAKASLQASSLQAGSLQLRAEPGVSSASGASLPAGGSAQLANTPRGTEARVQHGVSVAALLKNTPDQGVGFD